MTELKKLLGTSALSLMLVIWGLFMVCSGRVPDVNYDDDLYYDEDLGANGDEFTEENNSGLNDQLAALDNQSSNVEDSQRNEILEALGITNDGSSSELSRQEESEFLNDELFMDLEKEIASLEDKFKMSEAVAESLRMEVQETDYQLSALSNVVDEPGETQLVSSSPVRSSGFTAPVSNSQYGSSYQDALNDIYGRRYNDAIAKFQQLLQSDNTDDLADNSQYWIGEAYYALGQYEVAIAEFEKVFAYDKNNKGDDAQFMIGMAYIRLSDPSMAKVELQHLMAFFQDSEYLARAQREFNDLNI